MLPVRKNKSKSGLKQEPAATRRRVLGWKGRTSGLLVVAGVGPVARVPFTDQFVPNRDFDRPKRQKMKGLIRVDLQSRHRCAQRIDVPCQHQDFFARGVFQATPDRGKGQRTRTATAVVELDPAPTRAMPCVEGLSQIEKIAGDEKLP